MIITKVTKNNASLIQFSYIDLYLCWWIYFPNNIRSSERKSIGIDSFSNCITNSLLTGMGHYLSIRHHFFTHSIISIIPIIRIKRSESHILGAEIVHFLRIYSKHILFLSFRFATWTIVNHWLRKWGSKMKRKSLENS